MSWELAVALYGVVLVAPAGLRRRDRLGDGHRRRARHHPAVRHAAVADARRHRLEHDQLVHARRGAAVRADGRDHPAQRRLRSVSTRDSRTLLYGMRGGLAQSNIAGCAMFAAISGSSTATALTIGTVALPEMRKRGYDDELTLGTLDRRRLPRHPDPAVHSDGDLRRGRAGVGDRPVHGRRACPGIVLTLHVHGVGRASRVAMNPSLVPATADAAARRAKSCAGLVDCLPIVVLIASILGGMYCRRRHADRSRGVRLPGGAASSRAFYGGLTWAACGSRCATRSSRTPS